MHETVLLKPEEVLQHWSKISHDIEAALEHSIGELTTFDVARDALNGDSHVWVTFSGNTQVSVLVTRFLNYKRTRVLQIMTCGGSIDQWDAWTNQHSVIEDFAKINNCSAIQIWGRKGWGRRLQHLKSKAGHPYKPLYHVYSMEI